MVQLFVTYACQEVGLILDRVDGCAQPFVTIGIGDDGCVMAGCGHVVEVSPALLEISELYHLVAHHVGIWRQPLAHCAQGVFHDVVPIFLVQRYYIEGQSEAACYERAHLYVLVSRAVALAVVQSYAYVEQVQVVPLFEQAVDGYGAIDASGNQYGYLHVCAGSCVRGLFGFSLLFIGIAGGFVAVCGLCAVDDAAYKCLKGLEYIVGLDVFGLHHMLLVYVV